MDKQVQDDIRKGLKKLKKNPFGKPFRFVLNSIPRVLAVFYVLKNNRGIHRLGKNNLTGLLKGAMFSEALYIPNEKELDFKPAKAGRWNGYDFNRGKTFKGANPFYQGRIFAFPIEEIMQNPPEIQTPTGLLSVLSFEHFVDLCNPTAEELVEMGLAKRATYREVYAQAGFIERYGPQLEKFEVLDSSIYTITPKGNTLVFIRPDGGEREPKRKAGFSFGNLFPEPATVKI